jgi:hypothetical protein
MPIIEIGADTRGLTTNLQQANRALDETAKKADRTEREVEQMGRSGQQAGHNMSAAFAATGGGLAITHGLEGMASGFRSGNSAMAAFAASQALLDLGRFKEDMKGVTNATGGATSVFSKLGGIMRAHPLMTIATVLAGAASVMAIFGSETEETADEFERLADSMRKVQLSRQGAELLGLGQQTEAGQAKNVIREAANVMAQGGTYEQMAGATGRSIGELLAMQRGLQVPLPTPALRPTGETRVIPGLQGATAPVMAPSFAQTQVPPEAVQAILRALYKQFSIEAKTLETTGTIGGQTVPPLAFPLPAYSPQRVDSGVTFGPTAAEGPFVRGGVRYGESYGTGAMLMRQAGDPGTFEFQNAQAEAAKANMQELIAQGEMFGQTIGDAFFRVAEGTMTAKQALAELVRMFAQMGAQRVFGQLGGAAFGATQTQGTGDNMAVPGQGP